MPPHLLPVLLFATVAPLGLAQPPVAFAHELVPFDQLPVRQPTAAGVLARYGPPSQRVGADLWVYWRFAEAPPEALRAGYDTLIVHVVGDEVRALRLVNAAALRALLRGIGDANRAAAPR